MGGKIAGNCGKQDEPENKQQLIFAELQQKQLYR